jgi:signal transduction histidine kinase/CheY-like chemotaxis protein
MLTTIKLSSQQQEQQRVQLQQLLRWILPVALSMAVLQVLAGIMTSSWVIMVSAIPTYCFSMLMFLALWFISHGKLMQSVMTISFGFYIVAIALFILVPAWHPVLVFGPFIAVVVTLPYVSSRVLSYLSALTWIVLLLLAILSRVLKPTHVPPQIAVDVVLVSVTVTIPPIFLLLLWQYHKQLNNLLMQALEANASLEAAMAEAQSARAAAEQASELKTQFLANMSHELRTPLNSIINFTRILSAGMRGPVTSEQRDYLARVRQSGEHLLGLINDILDLSKIEAGRVDLQIEAVQITPLIQGVMATAAGLTKDKPLILRQELAPHLPPVAADRTRLRQILLNLLSNAAKFTHSGAITVRAHQQGSQLIISVSDTGIGIAPEDLTTIFEEFRQLEASANRRYEGTGLGLAICRKLVKLHSGDLWVESTPNVGSMFSFNLPIVSQLPSQDAHATLASATDTGIPLLVVDDDPLSIEIIATSLEDEGYAVYGLTDSRWVVPEARTLRPAAIILDVLMPHKDGWEVLAELKSEPQLQSVPIILYTIVEERKIGFYLGASAYLTKPIDIEQLRITLGRLVSQDASVLVIDDDPDMCEALSAQLEAVGNYQVTIAQGGQDGLAQAAAAPPDLIILDLMMPEVDGFAVLSALEQLPQTRSIPVIVLTAKELDAWERELLEQRVRGLVLKESAPPTQVLDHVRALLAQSNSFSTVVYEKD